MGVIEESYQNTDGIRVDVKRNGKLRWCRPQGEAGFSAQLVVKIHNPKLPPRRPIPKISHRDFIAFKNCINPKYIFNIQKALSMR